MFIVLVVDFKTISEGPGPIFNIIYIYTHHVYVVHVYKYIYRERERGILRMCVYNIIYIYICINHKNGYIPRSSKIIKLHQ